MYIFKNAYLAISRNKGRNILMGIVILVISCACTITLAIRNSSNALIDSYKEEYDLIASLGMDRSKIMGMQNPEDGESGEGADIADVRERFNDMESVTVEDVESYGNSEYVKSYYYTNSLGLNGKGITAATEKKQSTSIRGPGGMTIKIPSTSVDFTVTGYSSISAMSEFISGNYTITSGEIFSDMDTYNCVINEELASLNDLKVGDTFKLVDPNSSKKIYTFTITGIYKENEENNEAGPNISMFSNSANNIITSANIVNEIYAANSSKLTLSVTPKFILTGEDTIDAFSEELTEKGLSEYMSVSTNLSDVESSVLSVENVKTYATTFLIITLIIGSIVLLILNMINVRERKYEIGVLRTIGMKKSLLSLQFATELLIIAIISLSIGGLIGSRMSVDTANKLLASEIESSQKEKENVQENFGPTFSAGGRGEFNNINGVANVNAFTSIDAIVDYQVLLQLLGIGIFLTLISSMAAMINIQRFSPLSILKERS